MFENKKANISLLNTNAEVELFNSETESAKALPSELVNAMKNHSRDNVYGYIFGGTSVKIVNKEDTVTTDQQNVYVSQSSPELTSMSRGESEVNAMNEKSFELFFTELKADMREREERTRKEIADREERFEKQIEKIAMDAEKREERLNDSFKEREERIVETMASLENKMSEHVKSMESMKWQNFWGMIAMFIGMLAIVVTLILALK